MKQFSPCWRSRWPRWVGLLTLMVLASGIRMVQAAGEESALFVLSVTRVGEFLVKPDQEKLEFFRRAGRALATQAGLFEGDQLQMAGFQGPSFNLNNLFQDRKFARDWTAPQKAAVEALFRQAGSTLEALNKGLPAVQQGLVFRGVFDPKGLVEPLTAVVNKGEVPEGMPASQMHKIRTRMLPVLQVADLIAFVGVLTREGLQIRAEMKGGPMYRQGIEEAGGLPEPLALGKYLPNDALMTFSQVHMGQSPAQLMQNLREFPQTRTVESFLASAGLDLEKDILSNPGKETHIIINLSPRGEGGLPDVHGYARVKDPAKLLAIAPNLKQLAMSLGIFVTPVTEDPPSIRLSYFMAPQFGVQVAMRGDMLLFASGREPMVEMIRRMDAVDAGREPPFLMPPGVHRYWRIALGLLNEQLQRFLQGPLLSGKGIPPIPNLDVAGELGVLELVTQIFPDRVSIAVGLPVAAKP